MDEQPSPTADADDARRWRRSATASARAHGDTTSREVVFEMRDVDIFYGDNAGGRRT